jgi:heme-degrading monooxygenase HmoA
MHARVALYSIQPGQLTEAVRIVREKVESAMRRQAGFQRVLLMTDEKASKMMSISIWDSEEAMRTGESGGGYFQEALVLLSPLFLGSPIIEHYDVSVRA